MKTEETIYDNKVNNEEETQLDNQAQETQESQEEQEVQETATEANAGAKKGTWRKVATSMGTGILLGGVSSFLMGSTVIEHDGNGPTTGDGGNGSNITTGGGSNEEQEVIIGLEDGDVDMATSVNDDMSFSEAFAAARAEVGGGGAFVWNGNVYSTYTAEEWDAMTDAQKEEYYENLNWSKEDVVAEEKPEVEVEVHTTTPDNPVDNPLTEVEVSVDEEPEVEVLGVVHDDETGANFGVMTVDEQEIVFVDVNDDGTFDVMTADVNMDGQITENEIEYIEDQQISVSDFEAAATGGDDYLASNDAEPDFVNDAIM